APKLALIVTSHQHFDHWQALQAVAAATGAPTAAHPIDADPLPVKPDRLLTHGDSVRIGELTFDVIHLRGHTPGSIALALGGPVTGGVTQLFTGDCLFPGGVGKTWQPADFTQLLDDVTTRVFDVYADSTVIYPGHGDDTELGAERPSLSEWRARGW
ncbi:MBL fold metallo-hydrolase, partial [Mycobacterium tuberculosis]